MNYRGPSKTLRLGVVAIYVLIFVADMKNAKFHDFFVLGLFILLMVYFDKIAKWILSKLP